MLQYLKSYYRNTILASVLLGVAIFTVGATVGLNWEKHEVIPVILVKPSFGGFVPVEGNSIGNEWSRSDVKPVILVKPGISGYEPREGTSIGNSWNKDELVAVVLVEASPMGFTPLRAFGDHEARGGKELSDQRTIVPKNDTTTPSTLSVIESKIDGEFEGWEGETIVKLINGQIWQQTEYHYHYHYAFMPKILIFKSGSGFKMKVDGIEKAVGVKRLR